MRGDLIHRRLPLAADRQCLQPGLHRRLLPDGGARGGDARKLDPGLHRRAGRPLDQIPGRPGFFAERRHGQTPADRRRHRAPGAGRQHHDAGVLVSHAALDHVGQLILRFERHGGAPGPVDRVDLIEAVVHHAGRAVLLQQRAVEVHRLEVGCRTKIGLARLHVAAAHVVDEVAEGVGQRVLQPARHERRDLRVARLDFLGRRQQVVDRGRHGDTAFLEDVAAIIQHRAFDVHRNAGQPAADGGGLQQRRAESGKIIVGRRVGGEFLKIAVPAGLGELRALAGDEGHEHVHLVAARVQHRHQALAHLLLLIGVHLQGHAGQLLERRLVVGDGVAERIVVGQEGHCLALVFLPVEAGRPGRRCGGDAGQRGRDDGRRDTQARAR